MHNCMTELQYHKFNSGKIMLTDKRTLSKVLQHIGKPHLPKSRSSGQEGRTCELVSAESPSPHAQTDRHHFQTF